MLPAKYRLKKKDDFSAVMKRGVFVRSEFISLKKLENKLGYPRIGFITGHKLSKKAVQRNTVRRRLSEAVGRNISYINKGVDLIILPMPRILEKDFSEIQKEVEYTLKKANIL